MNAEPNGLPLNPAPASSPDDERSVVEDSQAVELIKRAVAARATELHVEPLDGDVVLRFRIDGRMEHYCYLDRGLGDVVVAQFEHMAGFGSDQKDSARTGRLRLPDSLAGLQVRLAAIPVADGSGVVLRLRTRESLIRPLTSLGLSAQALASVEQMLSRRSGLILVAGPPESGKTTTLYSLLAALASRGQKVATIEEQIAFQLPEYDQREVDEARGVTMTSGLAALLQGDAEVILVGELRDAEGVALATQAASGKLVLTTVASADVASALTDLRELCPDPFTQTKADKPPMPPTAGPGQGRGEVPLAGVIAQRLLRRLCQQCCERLRSEIAVRQMFLDHGMEPPLEICRPMACTRCRGTGYRDRLAVFEVAGSDHPVFAALAAGASEAELRSMVHSGETGTLDSEALHRVAEGQASADEVKALIAELPSPSVPIVRRQKAGGTEPSGRKARADKPPKPPEVRVGNRVVIFAAPDDPFALREVLVQRLGMHPTDAMIRAHAAPGILPDRLTDQEASHWVSAIGELGLHAEAIPAADVPDFGHAEAVHHACCLDEGLEIIEMHGEEEQILAWTDIAVLSVGQVPQEVSRRYVMQITTLTAARRTLPPPLDVPMPSGPELWVVCTNPLRTFRIDYKRLNYEYLGERKTDSATRNFRVFVEELVRRAPEAYLTPATRVYLEHGSLRHYQFDSPAELRRYTVFHVMLRQRLREQRLPQTHTRDEF